LLVAGVLAAGSAIPIVRDAIVTARFGASRRGRLFPQHHVAIMLVTIFVAESVVPRRLSPLDR
jgi:hypothetical protein